MRPLIAMLVLALAIPAGRARAAEARPTVVVTYSILGALVRELVGDAAEVKVAIPDGMDPHEWEPSAKDIEALARARLVVANGLGLEAGLERALQRVRRQGVPVFVASDHVTVRRVRAGEGIPSGDPDQAAGAADPHLWTDPTTMAAVLRALAPEVRARLGVDCGPRLAGLERRLAALDGEVKGLVAAVPPERRRLVTGHESMGYFAQRYGFTLVGAVVPGLSSQSQTSAAGLAKLKRLVAQQHVPVLFTELGTPPHVVEALARDAGVRCVTLTTHALPADGSYFTYLRGLAAAVTEALK